MPGELMIGEVASAAGVSRDTVRYYEQMKLIPRASRTRAGYRIYTDEDIERLRFIKQAQTLGLSLEEIRELMPGRESGLEECRRVRDLLCSKIEELDAQLAELSAFRRKLADYLGECEEALTGKQGDRCPVMFEISRPAGSKLKHAARRAAKDKR